MTQDQLVQICSRLLGTYRKKYKRLNTKEYYAEILNELKTKQAITNCFGITRTFLGDPSDNGTQREATAFVGQSATGGNMNRSMYEIDHGYIPEYVPRWTESGCARKAVEDELGIAWLCVPPTES
jgi:hypothetical protein